MSRLIHLFGLILIIAACNPKPAAETTATATGDLTARGEAIPESYDQPAAYAPTSIRAQATQTSPIQLMTGVWVSNEDSKETILFTSDSYTSYYDNEKVVEEQIEYDRDCSTLCKEAVAGSMACFLVRGEVGFTCYTVLYVDQNRLEMRPMGATDVVLKYKRVS